jgi:UDP-glucose 4-epimerase
MASIKKILVTGGAGFIGAHTAYELMESGFFPVILDDFSACDDTLLKGLGKLSDKPSVFYRGSCEAVIHFAAFKSVGESVKNPLKYYSNNIHSLVVLLQTMHRYGVNHLIFSSSCTVYGQPDKIPVDERAPIKKAESPYGATKQMGERILEDAVMAHENLRVVSLRYFNPIGAHPSSFIGELPLGVPNNLVPYVTQVAAGKREKLTVFGNDYQTPDGSCVRDYIHVVDLAKAHVQALQKINSFDDRFEVFNLGTGKGVTVLELIAAFEKSTGVKVNYSIGPRREGDVEQVYANPTKANQMLQWETKLSLEQALLDAWRWEKTIEP